MLKKISLGIISILIIFFSLIGTNIALENCKYSKGNLIESITTCIEDENFGGVIPEGNLDLGRGDGVSNLITKWSKNIASILFIIAVGAIVYASYLLVLSGGEEEKIKKAKDIIKWSLLGFILLISAGLIVMLVVKFGYSVGN